MSTTAIHISMDQIGPLAVATSGTSVLLGWLPVVASFFFLLMTVLIWRSTRRQLENAVPPAFRSGYRPGRVMRAFIFCSGVHPSDLAPLGAGRHAAHAVSGVLLFLPTIMAFLALRLWLAGFFDGESLTMGLWAAAGATLVFMVDLGSVWSLNGLRGKKIIFGVLPRVGLAVVLGYFLTKPFVVSIFKDEIAQVQRDKKKAEVLEVAGRLQEQRKQFAEQHQPVIGRFKDAKVEMQQRMDALLPRRKEVQARHDELHKSFITEVTKGQDGRKDGEGPYAKFIKGELEKVGAELARLDTEEAAIKTEQDRLASEEEAAVSRVLNDPKFAETQTGMDTVMREAHQAQANSIGRQLDLVRQYVEAGGTARKREYILWHLLFWLLDTLPITMKLAMRRKDVQALQDRDEKRIEAEVEAESSTIREFAVARAREQHEAKLRRFRTTSLVEDIDLLYHGAAHTILRGLEFEINTRKIYSSLARRVPKADAHETVDWEATLKPLRKVQTQILAKFGSIIDSYNRDNPPGTPPDKPGLN